MSNDLTIQNRADSAAFEQDYLTAYDAAKTDDALSWGDQFLTPAQGAEKPEAGPGVAGDISLGVIQAPRSMARGAAKAINNMFGIVDDLGNYLPALTGLDEGGNFTGPAVVTQAEQKRRQNKQAARLGVPGVAELGVPVPDKPKVETVTGNLIEGVTQFAVGFKGVDKLLKSAPVLSGGMKALEGIKGGKLTASIVKGALADLAAFDAQEKRLSNLIEEFPQLQNPVTEWMAADPDDGAAEAKFKQAVEGMTLGGLGDILFSGVGMLKKTRAAKAALEDPNILETPIEELADIGVNAKTFEFLGNPEEDALFRTKAKIEQAGEEVQAAFGKPKQIADGPAAPIDDYEINFARINGPDDIKRLMDDMVNNPVLKVSIEEARRGKRDARATLTAATDIDGFDSLMQRRTGDAFNAETIVAARKVYYDTTAKLMDAAKRAAAPEASTIDHFNFRKMVAVHHAVQKDFMGVRAEAGRALQAWAIPLGGSGENLRAVEQVLTEFGGGVASKDLARKLVARGNNLNTSQINAITQKAALARTADAVTEAWTLGLLTNPTTHIVNLSSNVLTGLQLGVERFAAAFTKDSPVTLREGVEFFAGFVDSQKAAMKNAAEAFRTGQTGIGIGKLDLPRVRGTSREILDPDGKAGILSKGLDAWGALLSKYAGGALAAGDEYSKTVLYQAQLRALAVRDGVAQGMDVAQIKAHVANVLASPPENIRASAVDFANYGTFTKELGKTGQDVQRFIARHPTARFVVPFVRTPANIFKFTFARTPLAPLSRKIREDIMAGGARRSLALSRIGLGTSVMAMGVDMSMNGQITGAGPADPKMRAALRRTGWQPYSVKLGDTYYSYARFEPVATLLGMSADIAEILSNYEAYDIDQQGRVDELMTAAGVAAGNQLMGKTFLSGFADLVEVMSDPERYVEPFLQRFAGSFVPAGVAAVERAYAPETSQVFNMIDQVRSRIPGLSDGVPPRRNIWGEPIATFHPEGKGLAEASAERLLSLFNPVYYSAAKDAPVDRWMLRNGFSIDMPQKVQTFDGVRIDLRDFPQAYDRLVVLRSQEKSLKYGDQTMQEFFTNLASEADPYARHVSFFMEMGNSFEDQQNFIDAAVRDYTNAAREKLLEEYPELGQEINRQRAAAAQLNSVRPPAAVQQEQPLP